MFFYLFFSRMNKFIIQKASYAQFWIDFLFIACEQCPKKGFLSFIKEENTWYFSTFFCVNSN